MFLASTPAVWDKRLNKLIPPISPLLAFLKQRWFLPGCIPNSFQYLEGRKNAEHNSYHQKLQYCRYAIFGKKTTFKHDVGTIFPNEGPSRHPMDETILQKISDRV